MSFFSKSRQTLGNLGSSALGATQYALGATQYGLTRAADATKYAATRIGENLPDSVKSNLNSNIEYMGETIKKYLRILGSKISPEDRTTIQGAEERLRDFFDNPAETITGSGFMRRCEEEARMLFPRNSDNEIKIKTLYIACTHFIVIVAKQKLYAFVIIAIFGEIIGGIFALAAMVQCIYDIYNTKTHTHEMIEHYANQVLTDLSTALNKIPSSEQVNSNSVIENSEMGGTRRKKGTRRKNAKKGGRRKKTCVQKY